MLPHWFYIDFYCTDGNAFYKCDTKDFAQQIFQHCPFLRHYVDNLDDIFSQWRGYKFSVPTYGAVLLDPTSEHVLLVQGFYSRESWGFPKGKVQENETPFKCAIREVMEEVGFDMRDRACEDQYLERDLNGQLTRLYIVQQVPLDTKFAPKTKNEIKEMRWFPIADLPSHRCDQTPQLKLNLATKAFFMVIPFVKDLRRWINQKCALHSFPSTGNELPISQQSRRRTTTYHGQTPAYTFDEQRSTITQISIDHPQKLPKQLSVQDTIQRHFSQILRNHSITVTDNTSITETLLMKETPTSTLHSTQLTPPSSNDDENKHPSSSRTHVGKKSMPRTVTKCQSNEIPLSTRASELNINGHTQLLHSTLVQSREPLANLTNDVFQFNGPRCWTQFRLNRSEVFRCLHE